MGGCVCASVTWATSLHGAWPRLDLLQPGSSTSLQLQASRNGPRKRLSQKCHLAIYDVSGPSIFPPGQLLATRGEGFQETSSSKSRTPSSHHLGELGGRRWPQASSRPLPGTVLLVADDRGGPQTWPSRFLPPAPRVSRSPARAACLEQVRMRLRPSSPTGAAATAPRHLVGSRAPGASALRAPRGPRPGCVPPLLGCWCHHPSGLREAQSLSSCPSGLALASSGTVQLKGGESDRQERARSLGLPQGCGMPGRPPSPPPPQNVDNGGPCGLQTGRPAGVGRGRCF